MNATVYGELNELIFRLLRLSGSRPATIQHQWAVSHGMSQGKANHWIIALTGRGWVGVRNVRNSKNRIAYASFLTERQTEQNALTSIQFLHRRMQECESLEKRIIILRRSAGHRHRTRGGNLDVARGRS